MSGCAVVHVVHCIDTEGPLRETLPQTFERLEAIYGVRLEPTAENLRRIQAADIDLGGKEREVARTFAPELLDYFSDWRALEEALDDLTAPAYRRLLPDSFGGGWVYNWHCLDHVGFDVNPRGRDMGHHNIFDVYRARLSRPENRGDALQFHYHPPSFSGLATHCATNYLSHRPEIWGVLARRVLDRQWFPSVNRPGFHVTRPDSHWFMEQHIPFDYANQASDEDYHAQRDLADGRYGDWRRAPRDWTPYHPDHDDYQVPGGCRRWIARCLNIGTRLRLLTAADVEQAFAAAAEGKPTVLAFTCHDFRDMRPALAEVRDMLRSAAAAFPQTPFRYCRGDDAIRFAMKLPPSPPLELTLRMDGARLSVVAGHDIFGPQPFFALKTVCGRYLHDNLDLQRPRREWSYVFDEQTFPIEALARVGVAACDAWGGVCVADIDPRGGPARVARPGRDAETRLA
jgi:hypothetical protein